MMKTSLKIGAALLGIGLVLIAGAVGSLENELIGFGRCALISLAGLASCGAGAWLWRDEI